MAGEGEHETPDRGTGSPAGTASGALPAVAAPTGGDPAAVAEHLRQQQLQRQLQAQRQLQLQRLQRLSVAEAPPSDRFDWTVEVVGLEKRPDLNGRRGRVLYFDMAAQAKNITNKGVDDMFYDIYIYLFI